MKPFHETIRTAIGMIDGADAGLAAFKPIAYLLASTIIPHSRAEAFDAFNDEIGGFLLIETDELRMAQLSEEIATSIMGVVETEMDLFACRRFEEVFAHIRDAVAAKTTDGDGMSKLVQSQRVGTMITHRIASLTAGTKTNLQLASDKATAQQPEVAGEGDMTGEWSDRAAEDQRLMAPTG